MSHAHNVHWCCTPFVCLPSYYAETIWKMHFSTEKNTFLSVWRARWELMYVLNRIHYPSVHRFWRVFRNAALIGCRVNLLFYMQGYVVYRISIFPAIPELRRLVSDAWMCAKESRMCVCVQAQNSRARPRSINSSSHVCGWVGWFCVGSIEAYSTMHSYSESTPEKCCYAIL